MSRVHPVIVRSAVFCIVWSLLVLVSEMMGDHIVLAYSSVGRVMALYVMASVSFDLPQCVEVSALSMFSVGFALLMVFCVCFEKVSLGSSVSLRIFGSFTVGSVVLSICSVRVVLYSAGSGVKSVVVVFDALSLSWLSCVHLCISCR